MKKNRLFIANLLMSTMRFILLLVLGVVVIIVGAVWSDLCFYIGIGIIALFILVCFISALRMQSLMNYRCDDDPDFNELMEGFSTNPHEFLSGIIEKQADNKQLHNKDLLKLNDEDLFNTVYFQNLDIAEGAGDEENELEQFFGARRMVYILSLFDSEIQNGGLCQFFVNESSVVAPYVSEALRCVGADEHVKLFEEFVKENDIDVNNLVSFKVSSVRAYKKQTKRFDFDSFDNKYYELPSLQEKVVEYIKSNINEF